MRISNLKHPASNLQPIRCSKPLMLLGVIFSITFGCQTHPADLYPVGFDRTPAAVQAGFLAYFTSKASIKKIERERQGDQDYYTFTFVDKDQKNRIVELNEGGDQVQEH